MAEILDWHAGGSGSPTKTAARVADSIAARGDDGTWLSVVPREALLAAAEGIEKRSGARTLPLYGVPFGVKDSIDVEGVPTTLSCGPLIDSGPDERNLGIGPVCDATSFVHNRTQPIIRDSCLEGAS